MRLSFILLACLLISTVHADHPFLKGKGIFKDYQAYSKQKQRVVQTDLYGNQTQYEYDMFNRLVKIVQPPIPKPTGELFYPTEKFYYDVYGYINKKQDGNQNITCQSNTAAGKPYFIQYPDGSVETMAYTPDGNLAEKVEKNGMRIRYRYDDQGRILSSEFLAPSGESLGTYTYAYSDKYLLQETDPKGHVTFYTYNSQGLLTSLIKGDAIVYYAYDAKGRKQSTKTYFGYGENDYTLTVFVYDENGNVIEKRQEDAFQNVLRRKTLQYDVSGNLIQVSLYSDAGISTTTITYNYFNQPTSITDAENHITRMTYRYDYQDAYGLKVPYVETTDPNGNVTIIISNTNGKIGTFQVKNPSSQIIQHREFFYDGAGQLIEVHEKVLKQGIFDREVITKWTYNAGGNVISYIEAAGRPEQRTTTHAYNTSGQKIYTVKPDGKQISFTYDAKGRLSTVSSSDQTISYAYTYDLNDNPTLVRDLVNNTQNLRVYDNSDRLFQETFDNGLSIKYAYDRQGRILSSILPDGNRAAYLYNAVDLAEVSRFNPSGEAIYSQTYQFDQAGNLIRKDLPFNLGASVYTYNLLGKCLTQRSPLFSETGISYDPAGNLIAQTYTDPLGILPCQYTYDDLYQLHSESTISDHTYQYSSLFNRYEKDGHRFDYNYLNQLLGDYQNNYTYDQNGNLLANYDQIYTYDAWDRLSAMTKGDTRYRYTYDHLGRRLIKSKDAWDPLANSWTTQETLYFFYQGDCELGAYNGQEELIEFRLLGHNQQPVAFEMMGEVYIPLISHIGNVQLLLNAQGDPVDVYRYTAFGKENIFDSLGNSKKPTIPWRFCGARSDSEIDLIYFGPCYYDPHTTRWITKNPRRYQEGPNLYSFAKNNPLKINGSFDWHQNKSANGLD